MYYRFSRNILPLILLILEINLSFQQDYNLNTSTNFSCNMTSPDQERPGMSDFLMEAYPTEATFSNDI